MWMWFWGIYIPNCYGSGTTCARGAPHGDGREGVFGSLTALRRSFGAPVSVSSARDRQRRSAASRTEMPRRTPCVPCNTFTAHPAAPLGSRAAKRRPVSFAQDLASREGQRPRCPYGGESGSGDAAPPRGLCASRFAIPLYLHPPKCAGVKNALRPYRLA